MRTLLDKALFNVKLMTISDFIKKNIQIVAKMLDKISLKNTISRL